MQPSNVQLQSPTEHAISIEVDGHKTNIQFKLLAFRQLPKSAIDVRPNLINLIYAAPRFYWMNVKPLGQTSSVFIRLVMTLIFSRRRLRGIVSALE